MIEDAYVIVLSLSCSRTPGTRRTLDYSTRTKRLEKAQGSGESCKGDGEECHIVRALSNSMKATSEGFLIFFVPHNDAANLW